MENKAAKLLPGGNSEGILTLVSQAVQQPAPLSL